MDIGDNRKGGAVIVDKSPLKFAMDFGQVSMEEVPKDLLNNIRNGQ